MRRCNFIRDDPSTGGCTGFVVATINYNYAGGVLVPLMRPKVRRKDWLHLRATHQTMESKTTSTLFFGYGVVTIGGFIKLL